MFALIGVYMRQIVCLIIFALVSSSVIAVDCDYEMKILMDRSNYSSGELSFKIKALNIEGPAANSSSKLQIKGLQGNLLREYAPWKNEKITIQRTSGSYSPNLEAGKYVILGSLDVDCEDSNASNNIVAMDFEIIDRKLEGPVDEVIEDVESFSNTVNLNPKFQEVTEDKSEMLSSSEKSKSYILPLILAVSIILNVVLIWKR